MINFGYKPFNKYSRLPLEFVRANQKVRTQEIMIIFLMANLNMLYCNNVMNKHNIHQNIK